MFWEPGYHQSGYTDLRVDNFNFHSFKVKSVQEASSFPLPGLGADWAREKFDHHDSQVREWWKLEGSYRRKLRNPYQD